MVLSVTFGAFIWLVTAICADAETLDGYGNESRTVLGLRVSPSAAQAWLPAPWLVNPIGTGPSKDANLIFIFINPWLFQDSESKPTSAPIDRQVGFGIPGKHPQTGETGFFVARVYHSDPNAAPGPYKNSIPVATVRAEQTLKGAGLEPATGSEVWEVRDAAGGTIELRLQYQRGVPSRIKAENKPRSAVEPNFFRIYRVDQGVDVVKACRPASTASSSTLSE